jgi:hypothetical protein
LQPTGDSGVDRRQRGLCDPQFNVPTLSRRPE